jgi:hypothetical protein
MDFISYTSPEMLNGEYDFETDIWYIFVKVNLFATIVKIPTLHVFYPLLGHLVAYYMKLFSVKEHLEQTILKT